VPTELVLRFCDGTLLKLVDGAAFDWRSTVNPATQRNCNTTTAAGDAAARDFWRCR
jgi:hypothetical protein